MAGTWGEGYSGGAGHGLKRRLILEIIVDKPKDGCSARANPGPRLALLHGNKDRVREGVQRGTA